LIYNLKNKRQAKMQNYKTLYKKAVVFLNGQIIYFNSYMPGCGYIRVFLYANFRFDMVPHSCKAAVRAA